MNYLLCIDCAFKNAKMFYNIYLMDDDDSRFYDEPTKVSPNMMSHIHCMVDETKTELNGLTSLMEFVLNDWRYDTLEEVMSMRTLLANNYKNVHESFHPVMDHTWNLLRRLTNMYFMIRNVQE